MKDRGGKLNVACVATDDGVRSTRPATGSQTPGARPGAAERLDFAGWVRGSGGEYRDYSLEVLTEWGVYRDRVERVDEERRLLRATRTPHQTSAAIAPNGITISRDHPFPAQTDTNRYVGEDFSRTDLEAA